MAKKIRFWLLVLSLLLPQTQITATQPIPLQIESVPRNGCVLYNANNFNVRFRLRNKKNGAWEEQVRELRSRSSASYIEKDCIWFGKEAMPLEYKKKYQIVWNAQTNELVIYPL